MKKPYTQVFSHARFVLCTNLRCTGKQRRKEVNVTEERDSRIKKKIFPISTFILSFLVFAILTTVEMKIIGNYIDYTQIPEKLIVGIFVFWMLGAAIFTYFTN